MSDPNELLACVLAYHERTKHRLDGFAPGPGFLDWASQPDPFRTYAGAPRVALPLVADTVGTRYCDLYASGSVTPAPREPAALAAFLELALGLTAWKQYRGARWALRSNPSSGNLHPTEGYVLLPAGAGIPAGLHHYVSRDHCLEQRCALDPAAGEELRRRLPPGGFLVGLSSIHWRESWKYGERAFRYCQHDVGHALATLRYAAAALGWSAWLLDGLGDVAVAQLLGLDRDEDFASVDALDREHPDAVLLVAPVAEAPAGEVVAGLEQCAGEMASLLSRGRWAGQASELGSAHRHWEVIDDVAAATARPPSRSCFPELAPAGALPGAGGEQLAATLIRQRRSAVALDAVTSITAEQLYAMLERLLPRRGAPPFDALPWEPKIHLGIFVHRVEGIAAGLYLFERSADAHARIAPLLHESASWTRPPGCPEHLRFYCLGEADYRATAAAVSCHQDIAADGALSLGMVAEFRDTLARGAFWYRRLFWEAGMIGQVLYLEAEARGVRGTGIGCYFDDPFHQVLALEGDQFQSLYHFTLGGPVDDPRLQTLPAYEHRPRERG